MTLFLVGMAILLASGLAALLPGGARVFGAGGAVAGCLAGLVAAVRVLAGGEAESLRWAWNVPYGSFAVEIDALSAFFLLPILGLSALAAVYGAGYLQAWHGRKALGPAWFFYNALVASMALTVVARNAVLFLAAWEVMALTSFFLVGFEHEKAEVREAGWTYLVATHLGTAFVFAFFVLLARGSDSLDFDQLGGAGDANVLFVLALIGFGTKAGFMPFHVWLPDAHPAAPSHVSAVMSGVMIKTGIYGLLRAISFLGPPPAWWGWTLVVIGVTSGVGGVALALAQHDLKRLLAYHSVENIGIIALGLGLGLLGVANGSPALAALGFAGGLLHVVNHAMFKGLLFLGAGSVLHATGTREIDNLGGLARRMPLTAATFLVAAVAISGLPPLNGFVSEFLIYLGAYRGGATLGAKAAGPAILTIAGLALIGGLAAACFAKAYGAVFLGAGRSAHAGRAHEAGLAMVVPMVLLAAGCLATGLLAPSVLRVTAAAVQPLAGLPAEALGEQIEVAARALRLVTIVAGGFLVLVALLVIARLWLLAGRTVGAAETWGCAYARPNPRMQYTSSSFAEPLSQVFGLFLRTRRQLLAPQGYFPRDAALSTETPDACRESLYRRVFIGVGWVLARLGFLQQGRVQLYVLYIAMTLVVLLIWKL